MRPTFMRLGTFLKVRLLLTVKRIIIIQNTSRAALRPTNTTTTPTRTIPIHRQQAIAVVALLAVVPPVVALAPIAYPIMALVALTSKSGSSSWHPLSPLCSFSASLKVTFGSAGLC